jgi:hypothetical protein
LGKAGTVAPIIALAHVVLTFRLSRIPAEYIKRPLNASKDISQYRADITRQRAELDKAIARGASPEELARLRASISMWTDELVQAVQNLLGSIDKFPALLRRSAAWALCVDAVSFVSWLASSLALIFALASLASDGDRVDVILEQWLIGFPLMSLVISTSAELFLRRALDKMYARESDS